MLIAELELYMRPPSLNGTYGCSKVYRCKKTGKFKAHFIMTEKGRKFKREAKEILEGIYKGEVSHFPVKTHWEFYYKGDRGRDVDSPIKICHDVLQGIIYEDDNSVKKTLIELFEPCVEDKIIVKVYKLTEKELDHIRSKTINKQKTLGGM